MERDDVRQRTINFVRTLTDLSEDAVKEQFGGEIEALAVKVGKPVPEEAAAGAATSEQPARKRASK